MINCYTNNYIKDTIIQQAIDTTSELCEIIDTAYDLGIGKTVERIILEILDDNNEGL